MEREFVVKVFLLSALIAVVIKYGLSQLDIPANMLGALIGVFLPTLLMTVALFWRSRSHSSES